MPVTDLSNTSTPFSPGDAAIRLAFIGCGAVVEKLHAPAVRALAARNSVRAVAAFDTSSARRQAVADHFPGCRAVETLSQLPEDVDLAIVASPAGFHAAETIELLGRGIHVLCEKPMAMNYAECEEMIRTAKSAGRILAVGHMRRFFPVSRLLRSLAEGRAWARRLLSDCRGHTVPVGRGVRRQFAAKPGAVLRDVGVHILDPCCGGSASRPRWTTATTRWEGGSNARISLEYADGLAGEVVLSRDWNLREQYFFQFENGWISFAPYASNRLEVSVSREIVLRSTLHEEAHGETGREQAAREGRSSRRSFSSSSGT